MKAKWNCFLFIAIHLISWIAESATMPLFVERVSNKSGPSVVVECRNVWKTSKLIDPADFRIFGPSVSGKNSLSKMIRDNPEHWWHWVKINESSYPILQQLAQHRGMVAGDAHLGNAQLVIDKNQVKLVPIDEGAGIGPFIFDITRLIMTTKAIFKGRHLEESVKISDMLSAYESGLSGRSMAIPSSIKKNFAINQDDLNTNTDKMVSSKVKSNGKFRYDNRTLQLTDKVLKNKIAAIALESIPSLTVNDIKDFAVRVVERGGSAYRDRIWISVQSNNKTRIVELKELGDSDLENYQKQLHPIEVLFSMNATTLMGNSNLNPYNQIVHLDGKPFWLRLKKVSLIEVPYQLANIDDIHLLQDLAIYAAFTWGQLHRKQDPLNRYQKNIHDNFEQVRAEIKKLTTDYLKLVKQYQEKYRAIEDEQ